MKALLLVLAVGCGPAVQPYPRRAAPGAPPPPDCDPVCDPISVMTGSGGSAIVTVDGGMGIDCTAGAGGRQ